MVVDVRGQLIKKFVDEISNCKVTTTYYTNFVIYEVEGEIKDRFVYVKRLLNEFSSIGYPSKARVSKGNNPNSFIVTRINFSNTKPEDKEEDPLDDDDFFNMYGYSAEHLYAT